LHEHRPQPLDQLGEIDVVLAVLGQTRTAAIARSG
jgi:hypothetical protein